MTEPLYPLLAISRLRMGMDGAGVTSLVAGADCPLHCRWCINERLLREGKRELVDAETLVERLRIDDLYFRATAGGVCFGGGESLLHADFIQRFRAVCPADWRLTVETSLAVSRELVERSLGAVDEYIVDCKDWDDAIYARYTGGSAARMRDNLRFLLKKAGPGRVVVRVPLIGFYNTAEDQARTAEALRREGVTRLDLFSYTLPERPAPGDEKR